MKKVLIRLLILSVFLSLAGCIDQYAGKKPTDLGSAIWISEDPDIWFEVYEIAGDGYTAPTGQLIYNDITYHFTVIFNNNTGVGFWTDENLTQRYFWGVCKFSSEKLTVKISLENDSMFNGQVREITFIRTEIPNSD